MITRSANHKNSTWNIWWERQENLSQAVALGRTSHLFGKHNYLIFTSRTYDSKIVFIFDHRLLCFILPWIPAMALQEKVKKLTSKPVATVETFEIFQNWTYIYTENLFSRLRTISIKTIVKKVKLNRRKTTEYKYFFTNHLAMRTNLSTGSPSSWLMCRTVFKFLKKKWDSTRLNTKQFFICGRLGERGGRRGKERI